VRISSTIGRALSFQLSNENYNDVEPQHQLETLQRDNFFQLFNEVYCIDEFELDAGKRRALVAVFNAQQLQLQQQSPQQRDTDKADDDGSDDNDVDDDDDDNDDGNESSGADERKQHESGSTPGLNKFSEVKAVITLQLYRQRSANTTTATSSVSASSSSHVTPSKSSSSASERPLSELKVAFQARVCRSFVKVETTELHFDESTIGQSYVKDLMIWNTSAVPVVCELSYAESPRILEFFDNTTGSPLGSPLVSMGSYYQLPLRLVCTPTQTGKFEYTVRVLNQNDSSNLQFVRVLVNVHSEAQSRTNTIVTNEKLNFGDCYSGIATSQVLTIKNITERPIEVLFSTSLADEVLFEAYTDKDERDDAAMRRLMLSPSTLLPPTAAIKSSTDSTNSSSTTMSVVDSKPSTATSESTTAGVTSTVSMRTVNLAAETNVSSSSSGSTTPPQSRAKSAIVNSLSATSTMTTATSSTATNNSNSGVVSGFTSPHLSSMVKGLFLSDDSSISQSPSKMLFSDGPQRKGGLGIEEISISAGTFRQIRVWYTPKRLYNADIKAAKLQRRKFGISLRIRDTQGREDEKTITCQVSQVDSDVAYKC
jgi:hypothetical protein